MNDVRRRRLWLAPTCLALLVSLRLGYVFSRTNNGVDGSVRLGSGKFFDALAPSYDLLNRMISLGLDQSWRRAAATESARPGSLRDASAAPGLNAKATVLDVACGTGDLAIILADGGAFSRVVALDPSPGMLSRLAEKRSDIHIVEGVAEALPFNDDTFDAVTVAFGVRNFENREKGLLEISRVLKSGGRLVVLEVSMPDGSGPANVIAKLFVTKLMPAIGAIGSGRYTDYMYLSESMGNFPGPETFEVMIRDAGLRLSIHKRLWPFGVGPHLYSAVKI